MTIVSVKSPFNLGTKEVSFGEFFEKSMKKVEDLEDLILGKMIEEGKKSDVVSKNKVFELLDKNSNLCF